MVFAHAHSASDCYIIAVRTRLVRYASSKANEESILTASMYDEVISDWVLMKHVSNRSIK